MIYFQNGPTGVRTPKHRLVWQGGLGYFNIVPSGNIGKPSDAATHGDDPVLVIGNGTDVTHRANALTVSYNGHATAFQSLPTTGGTTTLTGTIYEDNTIIAWGNEAAAAVSLTAGIGCFVTPLGAGVYTITLQVNDPSGGPHAFANGDAAIVVTPTDNAAGAAALATATPLTLVGTTPTFTVKTYNGATGVASNTIGFQFHVVAQ